MADTLRVYPVLEDGYGAPTEYPRGSRYRVEPQYPGATGDVNHDLVVYRKPEPGEGGEAEELGRHAMGEVYIAPPGQDVPRHIDEAVQDRSEPAEQTKKPAAKAGTSTK